MTEGTENTEATEPVEEPVEVTVPNPELPTASADPGPAPAAQEIAAGGEADAAPQLSDPEPATPEQVAPEPEQGALDLEPEAVPEPIGDSESSVTAAEATEEVDDVAAAVAAAGANVADDESFDSIAPGTVAQESGVGDQAGAGLGVPVATTVSWIPFLVYDLIWLVFAGFLVWQFKELPVTEAIYNSDLYSLAVLGGVVLAAAGPILILAVWIGSWRDDGTRKGPLFISSLIQGSIATLLGVVMWWGALLLLDQLRLGRLL